MALMTPPIGIGLARKWNWRSRSAPCADLSSGMVSRGDGAAVLYLPGAALINSRAASGGDRHGG